MELTPTQGLPVLAWIDAAMFALEQARKSLAQEQTPAEKHPITAAYLSLDHSLDGFGH